MLNKSENKLYRTFYIKFCTFSEDYIDWNLEILNLRPGLRAAQHIL